MMVLFSHLNDCATCQGPLAVFRALRAFAFGGASDAFHISRYSCIIPQSSSEK
jgi:hypothetical protein